ncbi:hypothetical protein DUNSADRAFT_10103 [Dunaliella salina]|uniref:Encoded protein n=1 Tax=Dunaliella salina TaxID=3046 RepID=A0ABQ7H4Z7_DUNSA|nr:hypothetical protein DUNSADRAFT_10103 [Dunaliella salina]|eukprot:KAF5841932.1 hypothetical protein DUNSADRAFT_10103 [Dunaliella salina]
MQVHPWHCVKWHCVSKAGTFVALREVALHEVALRSKAGTSVALREVALPEVALRSKAGEQPPIVWVTIGLLATDGLALQLKLKRADKPRERDRVLGVWCAYHPVGGALTVVRNQGSTARTAATTSVAMSTTATTAKAAADAKAAGNHVGNANPVLSTNTSAAGSLGEAVQSSSAHGGGEALLQPGRLPDQTAGPMDSSAHELDGAHQQQLQQQQQQQQEGQQIPEASGRSPGERDGECQDGSPASTRDYQRQQQQEGKSRAVFGHSKEEAEMAKAEAEVGRLALHAQDEGEEADALDLPD